VCHSPSRAAVPPRPSPRCCEEFSVNACLDTLLQSHVALMRMELLQLVDVRVEETSRPLREELATLKLMLARAGDSSESAKACTSSGPQLAPAQASLPHDCTEQKSLVIDEDHLYGCISPCGSPCLSSQPIVSHASVGEGMAGILAPMLQITPELHKLCEQDSVELSFRWSVAYLRPRWWPRHPRHRKSPHLW
jgi:hypothetical protein